MKATVIKNTLLNDKFGYLELKCPEIAKEQNPGRFFMISSHSDNIYRTDTLLNRPFAICDIPKEDIFTCLYMIVGRGTKILSKAKTGDKLLVTGPLGNYFKFNNLENIVLVAGGIGLAPMINSARYLRKIGKKVILYYGGRSKDDILMVDFLKSICDELIITTDDGSLGIKGNVLTPLKDKIKEYNKIFACGPNKMLEALSFACIEYNIPIDISLDEQMGCGVGACLGCMIPVVENKKKAMKRCCIEGPIFNGAEIDWDLLNR